MLLSLLNLLLVMITNNININQYAPPQIYQQLHPLRIGLLALKMTKIKNALGLVRKYLIISDTVVNTPKHITRAAAIAIFKDPLPNPSSGGRVEDLSPLYDVGSEIGDVLMKKILPLFPDQERHCFIW